MDFKSYWQLAAVSWITSFIFCFLLIKTKNFHGRWTKDSTTGIQKFHDHQVSRIGGVGIFFSMCWMRGVYSDGFLFAGLFKPLIYASGIVFIIGFIEDISKNVSAKWRLWLILLAALASIYMTDVHIQRLDVPWIDSWLAYPVLSITITVIAVAGVTNAVNVIDGFNGLASGVVTIAFVFLGWMAYQSEDIPLTMMCLVMGSIVLGFFVFNYPFGAIFLGDAGAYVLGFVLAWMALLLPYRNSEVSPWASLLVCAYPVVETLYSMGRRWRRKSKSIDPDAEHLHSLIKKYLIRVHFLHWSNWARNAAVAPAIWLVSILLGIVASHWKENPKVLIGAFAVWIMWYHFTHQWLIARGDKWGNGR